MKAKLWLTMLALIASNQSSASEIKFKKNWNHRV